MRLDEFLDRFHPDNPKQHDDDGINRSIGQFGFIEPPTLDERTGHVVAGHGRGENLHEQMIAGKSPPDGVQIGEDGMWLLPVVRGIRFASDDAVRAYLIASNRLTEKGGWNVERLDALLKDLEFDAPELLTVTGFDDEDIFATLARTEAANEVDLSEFTQVSDFTVRYRVVIDDLDNDDAQSLADTLAEHGARVEQYRVKGEQAQSWSDESSTSDDADLEEGDDADFD